MNFRDFIESGTSTGDVSTFPRSMSSINRRMYPPSITFEGSKKKKKKKSNGPVSSIFSLKFGSNQPQVSETENNNYNQYYFEIMLAGPPNKGSSRKVWAYQLPHKLASINWSLIDNPEYRERCIVYDMTNDQRAVKAVNDILPWLIERKIEHAEIEIRYRYDVIHDAQYSYYGGSKAENGPKHYVTSTTWDYHGSVLHVSPNQQFKIADETGYKIFNQMEDLIVAHS